MILSVTVLGSSDGTTPATVGAKIAAYLEGGRAIAQTARRAARVETLPLPEGGISTYYADGGDRPGRWRFARSGDVDPAELAVLLAGHDPASGDPLISAQGSAGRAERHRSRSDANDGDSPLSASEAASHLGVSPSYLRRLLRREVVTGGALEGIGATNDGSWSIERSALPALEALSAPQRVVAGYDLTYSPPKSVSVLWAGGDDAVRGEVVAALDEAVAASLRYLERHAIAVRVRGRSEPATDVIAADYLHLTSRALDPQLHHHVVVANVAMGPDGVVRALDARMLFHHAKTAAAIAGAELRHQLTARLGVEWTQAKGAYAEVLGVPTSAIEEMSTRRRQIELATAAVGSHSARARQAAAWGTRAEKGAPLDLDGLETRWHERLILAGYDPAERQAVLGRVASPGIFDDDAKARTTAAIVGKDGVTEHDPTFDRRAVVRRLAEEAGARLSGDAVDALADQVLMHPEIVALGAIAPGRNNQRSVPVPLEPRFSTRSMLDLEHRVIDAFASGRSAGVGVVPSAVLDGVLSESRFGRLSEEQRDFVTGLVTSGMRIQGALGAAGSGKTTALEAAVAAWQAAQYRVVGLAVGGSQAVVLGAETGIEGRTVASLIARYFEHGDRTAIDARTVLLVDEASLCSTEDLVALARIATESGAALRLVGDPAQHGSVRAGGVFKYLVEHHPELTPTLTYLYRQAGDEMAEIRQALGELRDGQFRAAFATLERDGRVHRARGIDPYDEMVREWYSEREQRAIDPTRKRSPMTVDRRIARRELNERARALLEYDGSLRGPELVVGRIHFREGDEVVARLTDRTLVAPGHPSSEYVRNGSFGTVTAVRDGALDVAFDRLGMITLPRTYLESERDGVAPLEHAYAITTYLSQGSTFASAIALVTDEPRPDSVYVGATRGQSEIHVIAAESGRSFAPGEDPELPVLDRESDAFEAMISRLEGDHGDFLASEWDVLPTLQSKPQRHTAP